MPRVAIRNRTPDHRQEHPAVPRRRHDATSHLAVCLSSVAANVSGSEPEYGTPNISNSDGVHASRARPMPRPSDKLKTKSGGEPANSRCAKAGPSPSSSTSWPCDCNAAAIAAIVSGESNSSSASSGWAGHDELSSTHFRGSNARYKSGQLSRRKPSRNATNLHRCQWRDSKSNRKSIPPTINRLPRSATKSDRSAPAASPVGQTVLHRYGGCDFCGRADCRLSRSICAFRWPAMWKRAVRFSRSFDAVAGGRCSWAPTADNRRAAPRSRPATEDEVGPASDPSSGCIAENHAFVIPQHHGVVGGRDQIVRHQRNFPGAVQAIDDIRRHAQARHVTAQRPR